MHKVLNTEYKLFKRWAEFTNCIGVMAHAFFCFLRVSHKHFSHQVVYVQWMTQSCMITNGDVLKVNLGTFLCHALGPKEWYSSICRIVMRWTYWKPFHIWWASQIWTNMEQRATSLWHFVLLSSSIVWGGLELQNSSGCTESKVWVGQNLFSFILTSYHTYHT